VASGQATVQPAFLFNSIQFSAALATSTPSMSA
jgi:hypothetical protein